MTANVSKVNNKWKTLIGLIVVLTAVYVGLKAIAMLIAGPTGNEFSQTTDGILMVAEFVIFIASTGLIYSYLRKHRVVSETTIITALVQTTASTVAAFSVVPLSLLYSDQELPINMVVIMLVMTFIPSLVVSYLVARIFKWRYDRKHSFAFEK